MTVQPRQRKAEHQDVDKKEGKVLRVFSSGRWLPHALLLIAAGTSVRRALGTASRVTVHECKRERPTGTAPINKRLREFTRLFPIHAVSLHPTNHVSTALARRLVSCPAVSSTRSSKGGPAVAARVLVPQGKDFYYRCASGGSSLPDITYNRW